MLIQRRSRFDTIRCLVMLSLAMQGVQVNAAPPTLADVPVLSAKRWQDNFMFTLDNSGSMQETSVPDAMAANAGQNCYKNHIANALYFNPNETYVPPKLADGTSMAATAATFVAAPWNGFNVGATWRDNTGGGWFNTNAPLNLTNMFRADYDLNSGHQATDARQGAYYMRYSGTTPAIPVPGTCYANASYTRVDVTTASADVQQNFANWFSYYRSRMQAAKTGVGLAFSAVKPGEIRAGFHTINNPAGSFLSVNDFSGTHRQNWYNRLYAQNPSGNTPLRASHIRIGEYFRTGTVGGIAGTLDPIQYSCQANYHLMATDGYWNEGNPTFTPGDTDETVPALPATVPGLTPSLPWPRPFRQSTAAVAGSEIKSPTLSDIATYYWATDLRPTGPVSANNVLARDPVFAGLSADDPATWQHLVLFGISIAATGNLPYDPRNASVTKQTIVDLTNGTRSWPNPTNLTPTTIDDLWHASYNSRGSYFNVASARELESAILQILAGLSGGGVGALSGLESSNLGAATNLLTYVPSYNAGSWTGNLVARKLDANTGLATGATVWQHADVLETQAAGTGWDLNRRILTRANGNTVPFRFNLLTTTQQSTLHPVTASGPAVVDYLRGDRINEDQVSPTSLKFRSRPKLLGDIVDSQPAVVGQTFMRYADSYNPGYSAFKTANQTRTPVVYFGANDGMLHVVDGRETGPTAGAELWAYVPSFLYRTGNDGIGALSFRTIDPPPARFEHRFYVNATPFARDVDFDRTTSNAASPSPNGTGNPNWKTVLVSGLGKGGQGYFALDATTPATSGETEAQLATSGRVLWEFTDPDMGYTYGKPIIVKTRRFGWVAILAGGFNNTTGPNAGRGVVYMVDIKTGALLFKFLTAPGFGSASEPLNLGHVNVFIADETEFAASELYATDMKGNVWRWDIGGTGAYTQNGTLFAQLTAPNNTAQPITTPPYPAVDPFTSERFVFVGTGRLLTAADITDTQVQSFYALRDGNLYTPRATGLPLNRSQLQLVAKTDTNVNVAASKEGWVQDLGAGERVIADPVPIFGVAAWATSTPSTAICDPGAFGTAYARAFDSANNKLSSGTFVGGVAGGGQIVGIRFVKTTDGQIKGQIVSGTGQIDTFGVQFPPGLSGIGVNYREILE